MFIDSSKFKIFHNKLLPVVLSTCTYVELSNTSTETTLLGSPSPELQPVAWICCEIRGGGQDQSGQAIKLFQSPHKISFTFHFDTSLSSFMMRNLSSYPATVLNERLTFQAGGSKHTLTIPTYFQGVRTPSTPIIYAPDYRPPNTATVITTNLQEGQLPQTDRASALIRVAKILARAVGVVDHVKYSSYLV